MTASAGNGEVRVEKMDKITFVNYTISRPLFYTNPTPVTMTKKLPAAISMKKEDIDEYIAEKKRGFARGA